MSPQPNPIEAFWLSIKAGAADATIEQFFASFVAAAADTEFDYQLHGFHEDGYDEIIVHCKNRDAESWRVEDSPWNGHVIVVQVRSGCETDDEVTEVLRLLNVEAGSPFTIEGGRVYRGPEGLADAAAVSAEKAA